MSKRSKKPSEDLQWQKRGLALCDSNGRPRWFFDKANARDKALGTYADQRMKGFIMLDNGGRARIEEHMTKNGWSICEATCEIKVTVGWAHGEIDKGRKRRG